VWPTRLSLMRDKVDRNSNVARRAMDSKTA
jgi:hypothetical protein